MRPPRPTSLLGLLWHFAVFHVRARVWLALAAILAGALGLSVLCSSPTHRPTSVTTRIATFNIEFFPKNGVQIREAFVVIDSLNASAIGLQEITNPVLFADEAQSRLGESWEFVHQPYVPADGKRNLHIGVLYDTRVFQLERVTSRGETRVDERTQPTLQVDLRERASDKTVTLLVVHFKAMPAGRDRRRRQFAGLLSILHDVHRQGSRVVVMGDFNATEEGDRSDLHNVSELSGMVWATEDLACSAFWEREHDCPTSRLDHILTWKQPESVAARGGCEDGCDHRDRCPLYHRVVSDHCPVVIEMLSQEH